MLPAIAYKPAHSPSTYGTYTVNPLIRDTEITSHRLVLACRRHTHTGTSHFHDEWVTKKQLEKIPGHENALKKYKAQVGRGDQHVKYPEESSRHIERIICEQASTGLWNRTYLVKWKGLSYDKCTLEWTSTISQKTGWKLAQQKYQHANTLPEDRAFRLGRRLEAFPDAKMIQLNKQPDFLGRDPTNADATTIMLEEHQMAGLNWMLEVKLAHT